MSSPVTVRLIDVELGLDETNSQRPRPVIEAFAFLDARGPRQVFSDVLSFLDSLVPRLINR
jgi:hypothetical protein